MSDNIPIDCPHCHGSGKDYLPDCYTETLAVIRQLKTEHNGAALARMMRVKATAMNQRLTRLAKLGLIVGRKNGREMLWRMR